MYNTTQVRWPKKSCEVVLGMLKNLQSNAEVCFFFFFEKGGFGWVRLWVFSKDENTMKVGWEVGLGSVGGLFLVAFKLFWLTKGVMGELNTSGEGWVGRGGLILGFDLPFDAREIFISCSFFLLTQFSQQTKS